MLRRNIRLRREYLYRKSLEGKERLLYEKKRKIKEALQGLPFFSELNWHACTKNLYLHLVYILNFDFCVLAEGKPIPTELRNEEAALRQEIDLEDENTASMFYFSVLKKKRFFF